MANHPGPVTSLNLYDNGKTGNPVGRVAPSESRTTREKPLFEKLKTHCPNYISPPFMFLDDDRRLLLRQWQSAQEADKKLQPPIYLQFFMGNDKD